MFNDDKKPTCSFFLAFDSHKRVAFAVRYSIFFLKFALVDTTHNIILKNDTGRKDTDRGAHR